MQENVRTEVDLKKFRLCRIPLRSQPIHAEIDGLSCGWIEWLGLKIHIERQHLDLGQFRAEILLQNRDDTLAEWHGVDAMKKWCKMVKNSAQVRQVIGVRIKFQVDTGEERVDAAEKVKRIWVKMAVNLICFMV